MFHYQKAIKYKPGSRMCDLCISEKFYILKLVKDNVKVITTDDITKMQFLIFDEVGGVMPPESGWGNAASCFAYQDRSWLNHVLRQFCWECTDSVDEVTCDVQQPAIQI